MKKLGLLFTLLLFSAISYSQFYNAGQEPAKTRWMQIKEDSIHLIYPKQAETIARKYAAYQLDAWRFASIDYPKTVPNIPTILHSNSSLSNGFAVWAPKRIEVVTLHSMDSDPEHWFKKLAIHETRHAAQLQALDRGLVRVGTYLLGQQSVGIASARVPRWFFEGDAVYAETKYSQGGRGREASFYRHYMAIQAEHEKGYSYSKWLLGSYKHHIPSHYNFGYMMVGGINLNQNFNMWPNAIGYVGKRPYYFFPFRKGVRKSTGLRMRQLFSNSLSYADSLWGNHQTDTSNISTYSWVKSNRKANYIEYKYPFETKDNSLIALKTSLSHAPRFIEISREKGKEKTLFSPGYLTHKPFINDTIILWSEYSAHVRWEYKNYSNLKIYFKQSNTKRNITRSSRLFNPVLLDSKSLAAIEVNERGDQRIVILNFRGEILHYVDMEEHLEIKEIAPIDNRTLLVRSSSAQGATLAVLSLEDGTLQNMLGPVFRDISNVSHADGFAYFTMTDNYRQQLFRLSLENKVCQQVTHSSYGVDYIQTNGNGMVMGALYSHLGAIPFKIDLPEQSQPYTITPTLQPLFSNSKTPISTITANSNKQEVYVGKKLPAAAHFINIHSWAPAYYNPFLLSEGNIAIFPGATLLSQNLTSTLTTFVGYSYNQTHGYHAGFDWMKWFPKLSATVSYGHSFSERFGEGLVPNLPRFTKSPKLEATASVRIPMVLSSGYVKTILTLGAQYDYSNTKVWNHQQNRDMEGIHAVIPYINFLTYTSMAHRDIRPKIGFSGLAQIGTYPGRVGVLGEKYKTQSTVYLPGLARNHSLMLKHSFAQNNSAQYLWMALIDLARGAELIFAKQYHKVSADYALPLVYPDWALGSVVYLKRIVANAFIDNAWVSEYEHLEEGLVLLEKDYTSVGLEFYLTTHLLNIEYPITWNIRAGYNFTNERIFLKPTIGFSLGF